MVEPSTDTDAGFRVLIVCAGNVCRSPLAELLIRTRLSAALGAGADQFRVVSAGTEALTGAPMDQRAAAVARSLGAEPDGFRSRPVTPDLVAGADLVLTATREQRAAVVRLHPPAHRYAFTVREFGRLAAAIPAGERPAGLGPAARAGALARPLPPSGGPRRRDPRPGKQLRRGFRRPGVRLAAAGVLVVFGAAGWLAARGVAAARELAAARVDLGAVRTALLAADPGRARAALADARRRTARAHALTDDPLWRLAGLPPYLGNAPRAVRIVAAAVDQVTSRALPRLVEAGAALTPDRLRPAGTALHDVRAELAGTASTVDGAGRAARLVPAMLGARHPRRYLVVFQNNAEARGTGGQIGRAH